MAREGHAAAGRPEKPMLCEVCGRLEELEWHCISHDVDDLAQCATTAGTGGYWLCAEICHPTAHRKMSEHQETGRASTVVLEMVRQLAKAVRPGRAYRRRAESE